jgi:G3E family GTPase
MSRIRFILVGGFLGAGKTTTIARLARAYRGDGRKVGLITNDQAAHLVDTHNLRAQGFDVGEVAGACFCCRFDDLTSAVEQLKAAHRPDVILAEPVGSCADLVATVIRPLQRLFSEEFDIAPYGVIVKPSHGRKILRNEPKAGVSPKAAYIFRKQLEEADFAIINRIDQLTKAERDELAELIAVEAPGAPVIRVSAITGEGFEDLLEMLQRKGDSVRRILDIDYDLYAEGEAELGWLNSRFHVEASRPFSLDDLLIGAVERLRKFLAAQEAETAHIKAVGLWKGFHGVANLTSSDAQVELSVRSACLTKTADVVVNARVAISPDLLQQHAERAVNEVCGALDAAVAQVDARSLRPGRPVPTHRFAELPPQRPDH